MSYPYQPTSAASGREPSGIVGTSSFGRPQPGVQGFGPTPGGAMVPVAGGPLPPAQAGASILVEMTNGLQYSNGVYLRPRLVVDGVNAPCEWGTNRVQLAPGRHQVQAGVASTMALTPPVLVDVAPGLEQRVFYAGPATFGGAGRIGLTPQKSPGISPWLFAGIAVLVPFLLMFLGVFMSIFVMR